MRKIVMFCCMLLALKGQAQYAFQSKNAAPNYPGSIQLKSDENPQKKNYVADYKSIVSVFPLRAISSYMMGSIETTVSKKSSLRFVAGYATFEGNSDFLTVEMKTFTGYRMELMWKNFIGKNATVYEGFYFAPNVVFKECFFSYFPDRFSQQIIKGRAQGYLLGYNVGYQLPIGDKVTLDGYVGQCIDGYNGDNTISRFGDRYVKGIGFQGGLSFGIGF